MNDSAGPALTADSPTTTNAADHLGSTFSKLKYFLRRGIISCARFGLPQFLATRVTNWAALARLSRWFQEHPCPVETADRNALYEHLLHSEALDAPIDFLEFGVYQGESIEWWYQHLGCDDARFFGFDCFEGLPEDWGFLRAGTFTTGGRVPATDDPRVHFVVGLFQDTLPGFLTSLAPGRRKVIHLDADLYSSTLYVLTQLSPHLRVGDILIFDEFGSIRMADHEFRAFEDFCSAYPLTFQPLARTALLNGMALRLT